MPKRPTTIRRLLIANRGEIACRIIRTCRRLGIESVAVFSEADARARHTALADRRVAIGPADSAESYLNVERILAAAREEGADAIHPGYGFLSENAEFAATVAKAGLLFVGPSPQAMRLAGDKVEAKKLANRLRIPLVPGCTLPPKISAKELHKLLQGVGLPAVVKAAGGGGGRGMRRLYSLNDAEEKIASARTESQKFFASSEVFVEKLISPARHIEVQILGDSHGKVMHLFDRDCSLQRNHQKVIEEAPAANLDAALQEKMRRAAVKLGEEAGYSGAGTVEFLVDADGNYYFLEVNARLQVEHPVTEAVTGLDLVELQIRIAEGRRLSELVPRPALCGHAIECRICAEDPAHGFAASAGTIEAISIPECGGGAERLRVDSGFAEGDRVTHYYDSLLAKLIASAPTRAQALDAASSALRHTAVCGVATNIEFLRSLLDAPQMRRGEPFTDLAAECVPSAESSDALRNIAAACYLGWSLWPDTAAVDPWAARGAWRQHGAAQLERVFDSNGRRIEARAALRGGALSLSAGEWRGELTIVSRTAAGFEGNLSGRPIVFSVHCTSAGLFAVVDGSAYSLGDWLDLGKGRGAAKHHEELRSPLPGKILAVSTSAGARVQRGDPLITLESMKMEHLVRAPHEATVDSVLVRPGDIVAADAILLELLP